MRWLSQNRAANIKVFIVDSSDHRTGKIGATLQVEICKDDGEFTVITPTITELKYGWYNIILNQEHTDTQGELAFHITAEGSDSLDIKHLVVASSPFTGSNQISCFDPTLDVVDGMTYESAMEFLMAILGGTTTVNHSSVSFKKRDGMTTKATITYGEDEGQRISSEINN
jgi:hypothetical protein